MSANAVVLLSGGLDSATCLAIARSRGFACYCLSFDYGQRHRVELDCRTTVRNQISAQFPHWAGKLEAAGPLLLRKSYFLACSRRFAEGRPAVAERLWSLLSQERESPTFRRLYRSQLGDALP